MQSDATLASIIRIEVKEREALLIARSPDLPGMAVTARDFGELVDGLPHAIEKHFAALGTPVIAARTHTELVGYQAAYVALPVGIAESALRRAAELT